MATMMRRQRFATVDALLRVATLVFAMIAVWIALMWWAEDVTGRATATYDLWTLPGPGFTVGVTVNPPTSGDFGRVALWVDQTGATWVRPLIQVFGAAPIPDHAWPVRHDI